MNILQRIDARLSRYAHEQMKGIGYPNPGWAPPPGWVGQSVGGVTVNDETARTVAAWYAGIRVISEDVASLPLIVYRRDGRKRDRATDSPFYRLLHDAPNPEMTSFVFREVMQSHLLSWGNAYAEKEVNAQGRTIALWPLRPDRMEVTWEHGRRAYHYRPTNTSASIPVPAARIFHIPGLGFDGLVGYSVLKMARETLGQSIALRDYGGRVVANDARPGMALSHPATLSETARQNIQDSWEKAAREKGPGRVALLEEGLDVKEFGFPPEDIQFLESQQWQVTEVARWLRLAPHKLGDLSRATFSNIEEQNIDHVTSTIRPWCVRWEQQLAKDVVTIPDEFAEHLMDALLRGKTLERAMAWQVKVQNKAAVPNEWRESDNQNPVPWGDLPLETPNNSAGGVSVPEAVNAAGTLIRSGFDPAAALVAVGLDPITHLGLLPVTLQDDTGGPA